MGDNREKPEYLEFSCQDIVLSTEPGEIIEDSFTIHAADKYAEGKIYSSDTRMRIYEAEFRGEESQISYCFDGTATEAGGSIRGEFVIISNRGEYMIPYKISVLKPQLRSSMGVIKNLFHFTNLAQANWEEAVALFYSKNFTSIIQKNDKNAYMSYIGQSRFEGNEQNVEEFLIEVSKKTPIIYSFDIEGFLLEDIRDSMVKSIVITKSGWGYSYVNIWIVGEFLSTDRQQLTNTDFISNKCNFNIYIDASKLHDGVNSGAVIFSDACNEYTVPFDILIEEEPEKRTDNRKQKQALCDLVNGYVNMRLNCLTTSQWISQFEKGLNSLLDLDEDNILFNLYRIQLLILKERFNEAKWYLDMLEQRLEKDVGNIFQNCYYLYLTTLINCAEDYVKEVCDKIETIYVNHSVEWRLGWLILQLNEDLLRNQELRWQFMEKMFKDGCTSPMLLCEAVLLLQNNPTFLLKLDAFEESVLWHGARRQLLKPELIEQLQYLAARKKTYSTLLIRILGEVYRVYKSPQTVASICHILILGDKKGVNVYPWYMLGVEYSVRVTGLYEYYMMSLELDKYGDIKDSLEIPKMVLMYFAYQSSLDYERNAFLYAYIIKNKEKYPDLEQSYRIAIERFIVDQIKLGHINENLAYLYKNRLAPQMIMDDTAYAFTPLLFMHRIYVDNSKVKNIVVIHEKVNGESSYPVLNCVSMIPIYGSEYKLFLQDDNGNRFTKSIYYENKQLMEPKKQIGYISGFMKGRLSFDIYLCEVDKNYITITNNNVKRYKNLAESPQVVESFKKEIRTKLLRFYYDNDMIGELDAFLEDIEADAMAATERAEFIRYMISRGMFDKAYYWLKSYGVADVDPKSVARLVSKRIVSRDFEYEAFLVNVAYYIYKNMKYDENILRYLMVNYEGKVTELRKLWKSALDLELDTQRIMERILQQTEYTGVLIADRDNLLISYAQCEKQDRALVKKILLEMSYEYFVYEAILCPKIFDMLYQRYVNGELTEQICKFAMLKFWAENSQNDAEIPGDIIRQFVQELLNDEIYFPFYVKLVPLVPELHYIKDSIFVEYRTQPHSQVYIHYAFDDGSPVESTLIENSAEISEDNAQEEPSVETIDYESYDIREMKEMYEGIHVSMFQLFHGETIQYYITENYAEDGGYPQEHVTQSGTLYGRSETDPEGYLSGKGQYDIDDRFNILNDILLSVSLQDEVTAQQLTEEYLYQDFCVRELFKVL
ncbi:hypothetical protein IMSAGC011_00499 [Lachnospiraceae bacterium]|nr:hypothetical protein IMSAGC011_00499 [Lachnospiraceae bacterium]